MAEELDEGLFAARHVGAQLHDGGFEVTKVVDAEAFAIRSDGVQHLGSLLRHLGSEIDGFQHKKGRRLRGVNNFQMWFRQG